MKAVIQDFSELSDSRELYETKPFPFGIYFTYIVLLLVIVAVIWAGVSEIDVVVKARGEVRPFEETNTISNAVTGRVEGVFYKNGDFVEKGSVIIKLNIDGFEVEHGSLLKQIESLEEELALLNMYKESVQTNTNLFCVDSGQMEENYYYMYKKYEMDLTGAQEKSKLYSTKVSSSKSELLGCQSFLESIETDKSEFSSSLMDTESYQEYLSYLLKIDELGINFDKCQKDYAIKQTLFDSGSVSEVEYNSARLAYDQSVNQLEKYISDTKLQLKSKIENYRENVYNYEGELSTQSNFKTQTLITINNQVQNKSQELDKLKATIDTLNINIDDTELTAPISGYINFKNEFSIGQYLTSGMQIATIIPENGETFKIQIYVPNKDISNVDVGDKVKYRFDALPYKEYGVLEGEITSISVDASFNELQGISYYLVESTVVNRPMTSYKGTEANIKVGMNLEAQVISESKKVLNYLLEKINLWD